MVTSTSTPASMLIMICLTTSVGAFRSIKRLWIRISNMSQVFEPSPQGVFRVVIYMPSQQSFNPLSSLFLYLQGFGRQSNGALDAQLLRLGALKELGADLLERLDFSGSESDANLVDFLRAKTLVS